MTEMGTAAIRKVTYKLFYRDHNVEYIIQLN